MAYSYMKFVLHLAARILIPVYKRYPQFFIEILFGKSPR
jgi:hypothetical protein